MYKRAVYQSRDNLLVTGALSPFDFYIRNIGRAVAWRKSLAKIMLIITKDILRAGVGALALATAAVSTGYY